MKKMMEAITEVIRDTNHPFRKLEHQPKKPLKNRYERSKDQGISPVDRLAGRSRVNNLNQLE